MHTIWYVVFSIPLIYLGVLICFYFIQDYLIFRNPKLHQSYTYNFQQNFEELFLKTKKGVVLNGLLFKSENSRGVVIYHHGNTGNLQYWGLNARVFTDLNYDVFIYDYRSYGKSTGKIKNERQLHADASFIYRFINKRYSAERIVIYGISLGTGIAAKLAAKKPCKCLILETPYFNFHDTIGEHYPFLPVSIISKYHFRTNIYIKQVNAPIFIFHGTKDKVITYESSVKLVEQKPSAVLISIQGGTHSDLKDYPEYLDNMKKLFEGID